MAIDFFAQRPAVTPTIYVYNLPQVTTHKGYVKVGYTDRDVATRINEQMHTSGLTANILYTESAMCSDGSIFTDKDVHRILRRKGLPIFSLPLWKEKMCGLRMVHLRTSLLWLSIR